MLKQEKKLITEKMSSNTRLVYLTRIEKFSSAHCLNNKLLDQKSNSAIFEKCNNVHGHNYKLEVTIKGPIDNKNGMVMNISDLKNLIQQNVLNEMDHKNIDQDVKYFKSNSFISTSENICLFIWDQLAKDLPDSVKLHSIKLYETDKNVVQYFGEFL